MLGISDVNITYVASATTAIVTTTTITDTTITVIAVATATNAINTASKYVP